MIGSIIKQIYRMRKVQMELKNVKGKRYKFYGETGTEWDNVLTLNGTVPALNPADALGRALALGSNLGMRLPVVLGSNKIKRSY